MKTRLFYASALLLGITLALSLWASTNQVGVSIGVTLSGPAPINRANRYAGTQTGSAGAVLTQTLSTNSTGSQLTLGNLAGTPGGLMVRNLDATNYVEIDAANTFNAFPQKVLPGQAIFLLPQTTNIFGRSKTNFCIVEITTFDQ